MDLDAIILAGGRGTRLAGQIGGGIPKPMAPVGEYPFLHHVLKLLIRQGVTRAIMATGFRGDVIANTYGRQFDGLTIDYSHEEQPLGTGGAIAQALGFTTQPDVFICNGDSYFDVPFPQMLDFHRQAGATVTIAGKPMTDFDRYGCIQCGEDGRILGFTEKRPVKQGVINTGVYLMRRGIPFPDGPFSLENDYFAQLPDTMFVYQSEGYFIDIGVPEDYARACREMTL
jgi:D-glycero-alpha-D-manno-heptose 1-phosphate guanylyltransferase